MGSNDYYRFANTITPLAHEARRDPDIAQRQGEHNLPRISRIDTDTQNMLKDNINVQTNEQSEMKQIVQAKAR